jgi:hypothetical protein
VSVGAEATRLVMYMARSCEEVSMQSLCATARIGCRFLTTQALVRFNIKQPLDK